MINTESAAVRHAPPKAITGVLIRSTIVAALGGLIFGFDTAVIAGTTQALTRIFQLTPKTLGITVSSALWGTILGSLLAGYVAERWGRRDSLRVLAILYLGSALGCALSWSWPSLLVFRVLAGLAIGGSSVLGPMYIAEIAPAAWRGRLVGTFQFNVVAGILLAYLSNYLIALQHLGDREWRWQFGVAAFPSFLFLVFLFTIPRSPRWLVKKKRLTEAREVLVHIGDPDPDAELAEIADSVAVEHKMANESLFTEAYRFPIFLAVTIAMFNQLAGINAVLYYLNDIFVAAGFAKLSAAWQAVAVGFTNLLFTVLAMLFIDRVGRRILLLIGSVGMIVALTAIAIIFRTQQHRDYLLWCLIGYIASFAFSQGAVIWVYLSEVFPNAVRSKGQSLGSLTHWLMNALIAGVFPVLAAHSGSLPFFFFAASMVVFFFLTLFVYPETKRVSLEQMQRTLEGIGGQ